MAKKTKAPDAEERFYTQKQLAETLGVSDRQIRTYLGIHFEKTGIKLGEKLAGVRALQYSEAALETLRAIQQQTLKTSPGQLIKEIKAESVERAPLPPVQPNDAPPLEIVEEKLDELDSAHAAGQETGHAIIDAFNRGKNETLVKGLKASAQETARFFENLAFLTRIAAHAPTGDFEDEPIDLREPNAAEPPIEVHAEIVEPEPTPPLEEFVSEPPAESQAQEQSDPQDQGFDFSKLNKLLV